MKKIITILFLASAFQVFGQTEEEKVLDRVKQLNESIFGKRDSLALEGLMADKVTYGHSVGRIENRQEMIQAAISNPGSYSGVMMEGATVFFVNKVAVVRHVLKATSIAKDGSQSALNINILQVWVKQKKQWKLTARQSVRI